MSEFFSFSFSHFPLKLLWYDLNVPLDLVVAEGDHRQQAADLWTPPSQNSYFGGPLRNSRAIKSNSACSSLLTAVWPVPPKCRVWFHGRTARIAGSRIDWIPWHRRVWWSSKGWSRRTQPSDPGFLVLNRRKRKETAGREATCLRSKSRKSLDSTEVPWTNSNPRT